MRNIVVVGSLNADLVQPVDRVPAPGETILGQDLSIVPGGKGGNQAAAAARLLSSGRSVRMLGAVGSDQLADLLLSSLKHAQVDVAAVDRIAGATGTASILVLPNGENLIVVSPAANGRVTPELVDKHLAGVEGDIVLCQLEIPLAATERALSLAAERGAITILDPAPAQLLDARSLAHVTFLTPNQTEAALLLHTQSEAQTFEEAEPIGRALLALGPQNVILKLGAAGCLLVSRERVIRVPGFSVQALDTTAAGDTFNGAFATALAEQMPLENALRFANAAAALSVTRFGAQSSIPSRAEVDSFLAQNRTREAS